MQTKWILTLALVALVGLCARVALSGGTLYVPADGELASLYGGACMNKTAITCNGAAQGCVETDCFRLDGEGTKSNYLGICCGVFECGTVYAVTKCALPGG